MRSTLTEQAYNSERPFYLQITAEEFTKPAHEDENVALLASTLAQQPDLWLALLSPYPKTRSDEFVDIKSIDVDVLNPEPQPFWEDQWYDKLGALYVQFGHDREEHIIGPQAGYDPEVVLNSAISPFTRYLVHYFRRHDESPEGENLRELCENLSLVERRFISEELRLVPNTQYYENQKNFIRKDILQLDNLRDIESEALEAHQVEEEAMLPRHLAEAFSSDWYDAVRNNGGRSRYPDRLPPIPADISPMTCYLVNYATLYVETIAERVPDDVRAFILTELQRLPDQAFYNHRRKVIENAFTYVEPRVAEYFRSGATLRTDPKKEISASPDNN